VEQRVTSAKCKGNCEGGFEHILSTLADVDAIFVSKIGETAAAYTIRSGKRIFEAQGEIDEIIRKLEKEPSLLRDGS
jgi:hypothetical protein